MQLIAGHTFNFNSAPDYSTSRGSSVSTVSDYRLDDRATGVRSPAEAKDSSSNLCVQGSFGAQPASYRMGTSNPFPEGKLGQGVTLTTHPQGQELE
jgi:hypothetical protein